MSPGRTSSFNEVARALAFVGLAGALGCSSPHETTAPSAVGSAPGFGDGPVVDRPIWSALDEIIGCDVEHRGVLFDFGTEMIRGRVRQRGEGGPMRVVEHDGATWSVVEEREIEMSFVLTEPRRLFVASHLQPLAAKSIAFYVDGQPLSTRKLKAGEPRVIETDATELPFDAGEHVLSLRFSPKNQASGGYADIDWIRVGWPDDIKETFGAPTLSDLRQDDAAVGKVPHRSLRLRDATTVRCPLSVPKGARFRTALGLLGATTAEVEIAVRRDGAAPVSVLKKPLTATEAANWLDVDASLDAFAGQLVHLELKVSGVPAGGRVLMGDPEVLVTTAEPQSSPAAQAVVVILLTGVSRAELPGYAGRPLPQLENLTKISERATTFLAHRASSNTSVGNVATLLTGLPPQAHTVVDLGSMLPPSVPTLQQRARDASIQTAMFTGVPQSFAPFGFSRGLTHFVELSPVDGEGKSPLTEASGWLTSTLERAPASKLLLFVHSPGAHPPWSLTQKQLDLLPPENYTGDVQARRAGQQLRALRKKKLTLAALPEADRVRLDALHQQALAEQDRELGQLLAAIDSANLEDKTMLIVTGDGSGTLDNLFDDNPTFDERAFELPLYVVFPGGRAAGRQVEEPTGIDDISTTMGGVLGLEKRARTLGRDLLQVASAAPLHDRGPRFALFGDAASVRWGDFVLRQTGKGRATLCQLSVDPTCAFDRRPIFPLLAQAFAKQLAAYDAAARAFGFQEAPVSLDDRTLAALKVWGSME